MFEHFTDRALNVIGLAHKEAVRLGHEYVNTGHVLLGLVKENSGFGCGLAANVLKNLDIDLRKVRLEVEKVVQPGSAVVTEYGLDLSERVRKVIDYAREESQHLGHSYIGTEHLLLGLLRGEEGVAAQILRNLGVTADSVREEVSCLLGSPVTGNKP